MKNFFIFSKNQIERIKKNLFAKLTSESVQVFAQVLYPPLMILFWGVDNFGIWIFFLSLTSIFTMFNFNFTEASLQEMSIYSQQKKYNKLNEIFQNTLGLIFVNLLLLTTIILVYFLLFEIDFSITAELSLKEIKIIFFLLIFVVYIDIFNSLLNIGIWYQGKQYISVNILTTVEIISKLIISIAGLYFESLVYAAIIMIIFSILKTIIFYYYFNLFNRHLKFSLKKFSKKISFKLIKLSLGHFLDLLAYTIKNSGLLVVVGIFFNANLVTFISTAKTLFYFFPLRFFNIIDSISLYEYAKTFAVKNISNFKYNHKRHILFIFFLSILFISFSFVIGPYLYQIWLSGKFEITLLILSLIVLDVFFVVLRNSFAIILRSTNKMLNIGLSELILSLTTISIYYYFFTLGYEIETCLLIILVGSLISLSFSIYYVNLFYKNKIINPI